MSLEWQSGWDGPLIDIASQVLDVLEFGPRAADELTEENDDPCLGLREYSIWARGFVG